MPPSVSSQLPIKNEPRGLRHDHHHRLHASMKNLECNRKELSQPWDVNSSRRPDPEDNDSSMVKKKSSKMDPPSKNDIRDERLRRSLKATSTPAAAAAPPKPDPIARTSKKLTSSRIHPDSITEADIQHVSKSSKRVPTKTESKNPFRRVKATESVQKIVQQTTKKLSKSSSHAGLYEEFPEKKPTRRSTSEVLNQSTLSCSTISRDDRGVFTEEVDWRHTSIDWGDDYYYESFEEAGQAEKEVRGRVRKR